MACSASTPAVRQKRPKQASTACHASSMQGVTASARDVIVLVMTLLSFKESTPGAYGSGQATPLRLFQHRSGHSPLANGMDKRLAVGSRPPHEQSSGDAQDPSDWSQSHKNDFRDAHAMPADVQWRGAC